MVQWLGLSASTAMAQVQSLVKELRSHRSQATVKKKKKKIPLWYFYINLGENLGNDGTQMRQRHWLGGNSVIEVTNGREIG